MAMVKKVTVLDNGEFAIQKTNVETGKVSDLETFKADKGFTASQVAKCIGDRVKGYGAFRAASLSACGAILTNPILATWANLGDAKVGKLTKEYKAAFREAETAYFRQLAKDGEFNAGLKLTIDANLQKWLSTLRADSNYEAAKGMASRYHFLAGKSCVTTSGYCVPMEVMAAEVDNMKDKTAIDSSIGAQLVALATEVRNRNEKTKLVSEQCGFATVLATLREIQATFEGLQREAVELANHRKAIPTEHHDVVKLSTAAERKACASAKHSTGEAKKVVAE